MGRGGLSRGDGRGNGRGMGSRNTNHGDGRGKGRGNLRGGAVPLKKQHSINEPNSEDPEKADPSGTTSGTKALVEALRSFSAERWWNIGDANGTNTKEAEQKPVRRRAKPDEFRKNCEQKHADMRKVYESTMMRDSEQRWLRKVASEGTAGDRVASLTMLVQVCPVFATVHLKALLNMAGRTGRSDSMMAVDSLKELFIGTLLPDRKLKTFAQMNPVSPKGLSKSTFTEICVVAFFEDYLKTVFAAFVQTLSEAAHSTIKFFKTRAVKVVYELLAAKPEQERALLGLLVNKFGDGGANVSSTVSFCLKKMVEEHRDMRSIVAQEIQVFLARPNISDKAQYFAILFLSEIQYSRGDAELAAQLVRLFVARLEVALKKKTVPPKSTKVTGRKGRFWKPDASKKRQALAESENRMVRTLISGIHRAFPYMKDMPGSSLQEETLNALYRVCHSVSAYSTRIVILSLLFKLLSIVKEPPDRFYRLFYEQIKEFDLYTCSHRQQGIVLLQKSVPSDPCVSRGVAMGRRLLQVGANSEPAVAVAAVNVLRDLWLARRTELMPLLNSVDSQLQPADVEEEEHFLDDNAPPAATDSTSAAGAIDGQEKRYQPLAREPRFARATNTPLWELYALACHVHPFVSYAASQLVSTKTYKDSSGTPFEEFSLFELLERFMYNARKKRSQKDQTGGNSKDEPQERQSVNSAAFIKRKAVAPHEKFFQIYFQDEVVQTIQKRKKELQKVKEDDVDEEGGEGAPEQEEASEEETDRFFDGYLEQGGLDDADADIDDDSEDAANEEEDSEADGAHAGAEESDGDDDPLGKEGDEPDDADSSSQSDAEATLSVKRRAEVDGLENGKATKRQKIKHGGAKFASAEDFEHLLG